jgi:hypothetical protein
LKEIVDRSILLHDDHDVLDVAVFFRLRGHGRTLGCRGSFRRRNGSARKREGASGKQNTHTCRDNPRLQSTSLSPQPRGNKRFVPFRRISARIVDGAETQSQPVFRRIVRVPAAGSFI